MNRNASPKAGLWLLLLLPIVFFAWYFLASKDDKPTRLLPIYGPKHDTSGVAHLVPAFSFTDQNGDSFTQDSVAGKVYVTEFFFTTCQSICPIMNDHLQEIYREFSGTPQLHFVSHTVDPETDSVAVLRNYAERMGVNDRRWHFLTGSKRDLYHMARKGYLLDSGSPSQHEEDDFVHTQNFALVDWKKQIRGFYDGTDSLDMVRLRQEIRLLLDEFRYETDSHA